MAGRIAMLLFGSGACALVYQTAWLREFRLVFGASTAASAAVLSIFVGGLGAGSLLLGPRADRHRRPLLLYAHLESLIALSAAVTPGLLWLVRQSYVAVGGTVALGEWGGAATRLVLASLVLAIPTFLMGGTLPAAARAATLEDEQRRRSVAFLYGVNTLGAVVGAFSATFFMFEEFGTRMTLWLACLVNLLVAVVARSESRSMPDLEEGADTYGGSEASVKPAAPVPFVLAAAAVVGFVFFLMELVWYRILSPLLGGSVYTFGLVLCFALLGIGIGGWAFSMVRSDRPATLMAFVHTCLLEAAFIALPLALGDRIATVALLGRNAGNTWLFWGHVASWSAVSCIVILPTALVAGYQFPLLVALLGRGRARVGREVGLAYAFNTAGAIVGSLAGGFGLIPGLSALGTWKISAILLLALGLAALFLGAPRTGRIRALAAVGLAAVVTLCLVVPRGPTAAWRHSSIGAGRAPRVFDGPNSLEAWQRRIRSQIQWEADGVESSVALAEGALLINGKSDGHIRGDAATMIMLGLLGPLLHDGARRNGAIGLGTGESAGWMARIPSVERVDVVELEELVLRAARDFAVANHDVLDNPKVNIVIGDAREKLLVARDSYDVIFSEPSNPYRAGVASLFTREYYEAVSESLADDGLFIQWIQAYEVDPQLMRTVYATLGAVFPAIQTWRVGASDLALVASKSPLVVDVGRVRERLQTEPYRRGLRVGWNATDLESTLAWFIGTTSFAEAVASDRRAVVNTDDRNVVEFGFARAVGRTGFGVPDLLREARARGEDRPHVAGGDVDWERVDTVRVSLYPPLGEDGVPATDMAGRTRSFLSAAGSGQWESALEQWRALEREPYSWSELLAVTEAMAHTGDEEALDWIERVRVAETTQADALAARYYWTTEQTKEALRALSAALNAFQQDPWPPLALVSRTVELAPEVARISIPAAEAMRQGLGRPFAGWGEEALRQRLLSSVLGPDTRCRDLVESWGDAYPWDEQWLEWRVKCYLAIGDPRLERARSELAEFRHWQPEPFEVVDSPTP